MTVTPRDLRGAGGQVARAEGRLVRAKQRRDALIRQAWAEGGWSMGALAALLGIRRQTVHAILRRR